MLEAQLFVGLGLVVHGKGTPVAGLWTTMSVARTSTSPVGCLGFGDSRITTVPRTPTTSSAWSFSATAWIAASIGIEDDLHAPRRVAQLDEDQLAEIAAAVHPSGEHDVAAGVRVLRS